MMEAIPMTVPVIALGIPASLTVEKITPYIIMENAPGISVYRLAAIGLMSAGRSITPANRAASIMNAVISHLQVDLNKSLNKLFPPQETEGGYYRYPGPKHMAFAQQGEDDTYVKDPGLLLNGPAHLKGSLLGASESFVVWDGKVQTGEYGDVYFVDWDYNRPRKRNCYLMLIGE